MKRAITSIHPLLQPVKVTPLAAYQEATKGLTRVSWKEWLAIKERVSTLPEGHTDAWDFLRSVEDIRARWSGKFPMYKDKPYTLLAMAQGRIEELEEVLN